MWSKIWATIFINSVHIALLVAVIWLVVSTWSPFISILSLHYIYFITFERDCSAKRWFRSVFNQVFVFPLGYYKSYCTNLLPCLEVHVLCVANDILDIWNFVRLYKVFTYHICYELMFFAVHMPYLTKSDIIHVPSKSKCN